MTIVKERPIPFLGAMVRAILEGRKTQTRRVVNPQPSPCDHTPPYSNPRPPMRFVRDVDGTFHCPTCGNGVHHVAGPKGAEGIGCPHGTPGDRLYVKEATWQWCRKIPNGKTKTGRQKYSYRLHGTVATGSVIYVADHSQKPERASYAEPNMVWHYKHARFMQKHLSRITLELTDVRVQRVQDITADDSIAEGVDTAEGNRHRKGDFSYGACGWINYGPRRSYNYATPQESYASLWDSINADRGFGWDKNPWVWALTFRRLP